MTKHQVRGIYSMERRSHGACRMPVSGPMLVWDIDRRPAGGKHRGANGTWEGANIISIELFWHRADTCTLHSRLLILRNEDSHIMTAWSKWQGQFGLHCAHHWRHGW